MIDYDEETFDEDFEEYDVCDEEDDGWDEDDDNDEFDCYFDCDCECCGYYIDNNDSCPFKTAPWMV